MKLDVRVLCLLSGFQMTANTLKAFPPVGFGRLAEEKQKGHMLHEKHGPLKQNISLDASQISILKLHTALFRPIILTGMRCYLSEVMPF